MDHFWTFFSFPLNILLAVLWMFGWGWLFKHHSGNPVVRFMMSPLATVLSLVLLIVSSLWLGLGGSVSFVQSVPFVLILLYIQTVLYLITLRGWKRAGEGVRWRFLLIHSGLLLAIGAGFWGSPDSSEVRVQLNRGESVREAYRLDGGRTVLTYELCLDDYLMELSEDNKPVNYEAIIRIDGGEPVQITVNHPHSVTFGEDIYLASVSDNGCVFQIVCEPWRYFALAGIIMMIAGAFMLFVKGPGR